MGPHSESLVTHSTPWGVAVPLVCVAVGAIAALSSGAVVPPAAIGVVSVVGHVHEEGVGPGLHFVEPFRPDAAG